MKKNRFISLILAVVTALVCLSSCSGIKKLENLKVTSANIGRISPNGLKAIKLDLKVGVDNPGVQVSLSEISCDLKHFGKVLGKVAVDPFTLHARTEEIYDLKADVSLGDGMTLFDAGRLLEKDAVDDLTVDVHAKVKLKSGVYRSLDYNDIPLKKLIETEKR